MLSATGDDVAGDCDMFADNWCDFCRAKLDSTANGPIHAIPLQDGQPEVDAEFTGTIGSSECFRCDVDRFLSNGVNAAAIFSAVAIEQDDFLVSSDAQDVAQVVADVFVE